MTDPPQMTLEQGVAAREQSRDTRALTYEIKQAANFTCQHEGCKRDWLVVVVHVGGGYETRCKPHVGRLRPVPGQWIDRSAI